MLYKILIVLLILAGIYMIYLGVNAGMQPPTVTGVGFIIIALLFSVSRKGLK